MCVRYSLKKMHFVVFKKFVWRSLRYEGARVEDERFMRKFAVRRNRWDVRDLRKERKYFNLFWVAFLLYSLKILRRLRLFKLQSLKRNLWHMKVDPWDHIKKYDRVLVHSNFVCHGTTHVLSHVLNVLSVKWFFWSPLKKL
jgi:hypothetical protein